MYPIRRGPVLELLPSRPVEFRSSENPEYAGDYERAFRQPFEMREGVMPWGAPEISQPAWAAKRERQVDAVLRSLVGDEIFRSPVLCDISAGCGQYTFALARHFKWVLHCDLSVDSLSYAARKSAQMGISNILFLRVDYFRMPFAHSLDRILCFDTLIRGKVHEEALLRQIRRALRPGGKATVDFHNWWHNPLRRLGLLPENFGQNRSYARTEAESLLRICGIDRWKFIRFCQEFDPASRMHRTLSPLIPPARLMFEFELSSSMEAQEQPHG
jgi:SAM-dependent methyltransferase